MHNQSSAPRLEELSSLAGLEMIIYVYRNCSLVFRVAEDQLGIPSLLDPVDMAECESPDRLSILTYLSEFYHKFKAEKSPEVNKKNVLIR